MTQGVKIKNPIDDVFTPACFTDMNREQHMITAKPEREAIDYGMEEVSALDKKVVPWIPEIKLDRGANEGLQFAPE
jgi:hypothetical protein